VNDGHYDYANNNERLSLETFTNAIDVIFLILIKQERETCEGLHLLPIRP